MTASDVRRGGGGNCGDGGRIGMGGIEDLSHEVLPLRSQSLGDSGGIDITELNIGTPGIPGSIL